MNDMTWSMQPNHFKEYLDKIKKKKDWVDFVIPGLEIKV